MLRTCLKKLTINKTTSTVTLEHADSGSSIWISKELRAIAILLWGYNIYGKSAVPIERYTEIDKIFEELVREIKEFL